MAEEGKPENFDVGLETILASPDTVLLFREFLKGSYSSENLAFIIEVENFKDLWSQGAEDSFIKKRAEEIYNKYFSAASQYELNIPGPLAEDLKEKMKNATTSTFNRVQQSIFKLVETDSYPRFIKSQLFQTHWTEMQKSKKKKEKEKEKVSIEGVFKKEKKKNPLYSKLAAEAEEARNNRSSTVAMLEEFYETRGSKQEIVQNLNKFKSDKPLY